MEVDYKELFYRLIKALALCEHMGDVGNEFSQALKLAGDDIEWDDESELYDLLEKRGVGSLYDDQFAE